MVRFKFGRLSNYRIQSVIAHQLSGFNNSIARQRGLGEGLTLESPRLCPSGATVEGGYGTTLLQLGS